MPQLMIDFDTEIRRQQDALATQYIPLATHVAKKFAPAALLRDPLDREDLIAAAMLGIVEASRTFDPRRGVNFITHATWQARGRLSRAILQMRRRGFRGSASLPKRVYLPGRKEADGLNDIPTRAGEQWSDQEWDSMLSRLGKRKRRILTLHYRHGMGYPEIARRLRIRRVDARRLGQAAIEELGDLIGQELVA